MSKKTWMPLLVAAGVALSALPFTASAQSKQGYWVQPSTDLVWKNSSGQSWFIGIPLKLRPFIWSRTQTGPNWPYALMS